MKRISLTLCAATLMLFSCNDSSSSSDAKTDGKDSVKSTTTTTDTKMSTDQPMDSAAEMKAYMDYATPGTAHAMMAKYTGNWSQEMTMWMKPEDQPVKTTVTAVTKMLLGGRYQQTIVTGNMMGMPFEGVSTMAYDNAKKMFVNTWMDNMGSGIMTMEGPWDSTAKSISLKGKCWDPAVGREIDLREVYTMVDDKTQKFEMWCTKYGKEFKTMESTMKKK